MIIGIDDSGNFDTDLQSLFAIVFIRPKRYEKIKAYYLKWEESLPDDVRVNGEVKGYKLSNDQLLSFTKTVLQNPYYGIRYLVYGIETTGMTPENIEKQKQRHLKQYDDAVEMYKSQGKKYDRMADHYTRQKAWVSKRSPKTLLKIQLLGYTVYEAFREAIIFAAIKGIDRELASLQFKIDKSFATKPEHLHFWSDMVRNSLWHLSYSAKGIKAIPHITNWNSHHPFLKKFYENPADKSEKATFTPAFRKSMDFYDSGDHFEVRIADIVASTVFRKHIKNEDLAAYQELRKANLIDRSYTLIRLTDENVHVPNPYTDLQ